jgi:di/tricarboxylate transporter
MSRTLLGAILIILILLTTAWAPITLFSAYWTEGGLGIKEWSAAVGPLAIVLISSCWFVLKKKKRIIS